MNALSVIFPYRLEGVWVFDDAATSLVREPFIGGADNILDVLTENIPDAANGFKIIFSARPFPGYTARFVWTRTEYGGYWYRWPEREMEGVVSGPAQILRKPSQRNLRAPPKAREIKTVRPAFLRPHCSLSDPTPCLCGPLNGRTGGTSQSF
jgi:hypothetical protein